MKNIIPHEQMVKTKNVTKNYENFDNFCTNNHCRGCTLDTYTETMSECATLFNELKTFKLSETEIPEEKMNDSISLTELLIGMNEKMDKIIELLEEKR